MSFLSSVFGAAVVALPMMAAATAIILPGDRAADPACRIAAEELRKYWREICGEDLRIAPAPEGGGPVIRFVSEPAASDGLDSYGLVSLPGGGLEVRSANGRCALYAVYDFLARRGGCRWFWDGDVVPKGPAPRLDGLDVRETSRFRYRGTRYFAHRGLARFQPEHWGFEDWAREIDWCLKSRVNTIMLRIGQDDLFQKAFPDIVGYPDPAKPLPEAMPGYNNRTLFWPLQYRGELRRKVLAYARERGLIVPEDFGTMSHWYSRTPWQFLRKVNPPFLPQQGGSYGEPTDRVWDIRDVKWLDAYWKITEASIRNYGKDPPEVLHTVGLGERLCFTNRTENFRMKAETLDRLVDYAKAKYPASQVVFASWDFYDTWKPEEVRDQVARLDPDKLLLWDYEADATEPGRSNFTEWGMIGKFPYTFGIFLCYEGALDARADYRVIAARQRRVAGDPFCKGYLFWPEASHTDTLFLRYFAENCWRADHPDIGPILEEFCRDRYGRQAAAFEGLWRQAIAVADAYDYGGNYASSVVPFTPWAKRTKCRNNHAAELASAPGFFKALAALDWTDGFVRRDAIDLARLMADRLIAASDDRLERLFGGWRAGTVPAEDVRAEARRYVRLGELMADVLALHADYSLAETLRRTDAIERIRYPKFGEVLLDNASCYYCRSHQYELARHWYLPVMRRWAGSVEGRLASDDRSDLPRPADHSESVHARLLKTPLPSLAPSLPRTAEQYRRTMSALADM